MPYKNSEKRRQYNLLWNRKRAAAKKAARPPKTVVVLSEEERKARSREYGRAHYIKNREKISEQRKQRVLQDESLRLKAKNRNLLFKYGITLDDFHAKMEAQQGLCAICDVSLSEVRINVDHNHKTGAVRGLLCMGCNVALGFLEKEQFVKRASRYLEQYR